MKIQKLLSFYFGILLVLVCGCDMRQEADLMIYNGKIYTLNASDDMVDAMVIRNGFIVFAGKKEEALKRFYCRESEDLKSAFVYPGFNDAHSHFYGLGLNMQNVDLTGTKSWDEILDRCKLFYRDHRPTVLRGRGWDQNDWDLKEYPDNRKLNELFPGVPVILKRVDGHAAIVSNQLLHMAHLTGKSKIERGEILLSGNQPTGLLIDNAVDTVENSLPSMERGLMIKALLEAEKTCLSLGLTTVCDAGLERDVIDLIDSLQGTGQLRVRIYAMINVSDANLDYYLSKGIVMKDRLNLSSFKLYCDGALGSRGACLLDPYSDLPGHIGFLLTPAEKIKGYIKRIAGSRFQLNTHCIGDSANRYMLKLYGQALGERNDRRWRIEHAQVLNENDFAYFGRYSIIPSVQSTHATSDMYWAENRLGKSRIAGAYAYKRLLEQNGWIPLGTDFPVESPNPLFTFFAAVSRQDGSGFPEGGYYPEQKLSRQEALKGITIWPATAAFEEDKKGTLETGKFADFVVTPTDLMRDDLRQIRKAKITATYIGGVKVFE